MQSVFRWIEQFGAAGLALEAIVASAISIALLIAFVLAHRAYRAHHFRRRTERTLAIRKQWEGILDGSVPAETWRFHRLDRQIVESILLDRLEVAPPEEAERLVKCLRLSGLLDVRVYEARKFRGLSRRQALVSLGRMQAPEGIPALAEGLDDPHADARLDAVRGLGKTGLPEAAVPILDRITHGQLRVAVPPLQNALLHCCRSRPSLLLSYVREADDDVRPLLARVLGEVASPELGPDLLLLASDPLPEVRASAARAMGEARPPAVLTALTSLAKDDEWFVRLRALVALGQLDDPRTIPVLIEGLSDSNRHVRVRAAWALAQLEAYVEEIFDVVVQKQDGHALGALISELERSGGIFRLIEALANRVRYGNAEQALLAALQAGAPRVLLDALVHHANWRVRLAVARLVARSGGAHLVPQLERLAAAAKSRREKRVVDWVLLQLRAKVAPGPQPEGVIA